jgi:protein-disulfide isomerase
MNAFNTCFKADKYSPDIQAEFDSGKTAGVTGTPTVFINGTILSPQYVPTYDQIKTAIDAALAGSGG